jgi:hypothetical protein
MLNEEKKKSVLTSITASSKGTLSIAPEDRLSLLKMETKNMTTVQKLMRTPINVFERKTQFDILEKMVDTYIEDYPVKR